MSQIYRFFPVNSFNFKNPEAFKKILEFNETTEPEIFHQLTRVLRIKTGDKIALVDQNGSKPFFDNYFAVDIVTPKKLLLRFEEKIINEAELEFMLGLVLCLPNKPDKLTFILQKAAELGVKKITLVEGDFSQFKHKLNFERLKKILIEASEQSGRAQIPVLENQKKLKNYLLKSKIVNEPQVLVAMEKISDSTNMPSRSEVKPLLPRRSLGEVGATFNFNKAKDFASYASRGGMNILIGPEGGFSPEEMGLIAKLQLPCFSLGKRILRMETAVILSLGLAVLEH